MGNGTTGLSPACAWGTKGEFLPPRWLRNPHIQSIVPSLPLWGPRVLRDCRDVLAASRREVVDCGAGVRLLALRAVPARRRADTVPRTAVLLHGWEGSADSPDIVSLAQYLFKRGVEVVRLNLRDHGDTQDLNLGLFHSCRLAEVIGAVRRLQHDNPDSELSLIGFSLGGNFGLRVAARAGCDGLDLAHIVAVCPVVDPANALARIDGSLLYRRHFVKRWRRSLLQKAEAWPDRYNFGELLRMSRLTQMADEFVRKHTEYHSLDHYLKSYTLVGDALRRLDVDSWLIAATDDPILPMADVDRLPRLQKLHVTRTRFGGHCGFIDGLSGPSWLARSIERKLRGLKTSAGTPVLKEPIPR